MTQKKQIKIQLPPLRRHEGDSDPKQLILTINDVESTGEVLKSFLAKNPQLSVPLKELFLSYKVERERIMSDDTQ